MCQFWIINVFALNILIELSIFCHVYWKLQFMNYFMPIIIFTALPSFNFRGRISAKKREKYDVDRFYAPVLIVFLFPCFICGMFDPRGRPDCQLVNVRSICKNKKKRPSRAARKGWAMTLNAKHAPRVIDNYSRIIMNASAPINAATMRQLSIQNFVLKAANWFY